MGDSLSFDLEDVSTEDAIRIQDKIREDPVYYVKEYLGVEHWWQGMERMLNALPRAIKERKPVVVGSGHALSKDFTISGCAPLWFLHAYAPSAIVAMTAPSDRQVKKVMWGELSRRYHGRRFQDPFGRLLVCNLHLSDDWYALAFTTKETGGMVGKFQGFHAQAVMVITSEAQAIEDTIYEEIDGIMTSNVALQVHLGNPLHTTGKYAAMLKNSTDNIVINLSCYESPNYIEGREVIPGMCTREWVDDKKKKWGENDPRYVARVLGRVPRTSVDNVISEEIYDACIGRSLYESVKRGVIGVDPARFGDDDMVLSVLESGELIREVVIPKCDTVEGAGHIAMLQKEYFPSGGIVVVVDCDGIGGGHLDVAKRMIPDELNITWVEFHGSSTDREIVGSEYHNLRAECEFFAKEQMQAGNISLDDDQFAKEEATETKYFINLKGRIQIEDKEDLKERLGRSPNRWNARALAIWGLKYAEPIREKDGWRDESYSMSEGSAMSA